MVADLHGCNENRLRRLLDDALDEEEQVKVVAHLSLCEVCQNAIDALAAQGRRWGTLQDFLGDCLDDFGDVHDRPKDGPSPDACFSRVDDDDDDLSIMSLLDPPENPDKMGRIGPYDVDEVVGRGGMGVVLKGFDQALSRPVAIKVMGPELAFLSAARKRFAREARAAAAVAHEHVVAIHAVDSWKGLPYLVMQYIAGISLQARIDRDGPLSVVEILRIGKQIASGLAVAHEQGLVHRDIKPSNILLENGVERIKITDFGLARAVADASLSQSGLVSGTPQYMAPEQTRCEKVDPRADLFSLGSVMYAMCTGHSPFRAETTMAVLRRVCDDTPRPIRSQNSEIPEWLADIIATLHAKNPDARFQSAAEVEHLLGRCLTHLELSAGGPPPFRLPGHRFSGALRRKWSALAGGLLVLVTGVGICCYTTERERLSKSDQAVKLHVTEASALRGAVSDRYEPAKPDSADARQGNLDEKAFDRRIATKLDRRPTVTAVGTPTGRIDGGSISTAEHIAEFLKPVPLAVASEIPRWEAGIVSSAAYSTDGKLLALGCGDGSVMICETSTRKPCAVLNGQAGRVWSVAFSPDGQSLAAASGKWIPSARTGQVKLWDVANGTLLADLADTGSLQLAVAFSPDAKTIAWGGRDRTITLWDTELMRVRAVCAGHEWTIRSLVFHPTEPVIVSAGFDGTIRFWDTQTGGERGPAIRHNGRSSNCVAISPDGKLLAANSGPRSDEPGVEGPAPGWITFWDWDTRQKVRGIEGFRFDILGIAFSPDGKTLATAGGFYTSGAEVAIWDVATGMRLAALVGHKFWAECITFSPDGKNLISTGGAEPDFGEVRVWDLTRPR
jgi:serine/threonine protein kinase/WD40 repeat protein